jgi:CRP-like cAMP-binding protein
MFELLRSHIEKRIHLTEEEFDRGSRLFTPRNIRRRQFLLQEGDVCKHLAFVNSGCLREYSVDHKGDEHIIQFAIADWWISDLHSFLSGMPSTHSIDVLMDADVLLLEKSAREKLFEAVPKMERFFRMLLEANYIATHTRITETLSDSAEERYLKFVRTYPQMVEQIPQHQIASYLGITPQSLSRIRKELSDKS